MEPLKEIGYRYLMEVPERLDSERRQGKVFGTRTTALWGAQFLTHQILFSAQKKYTATSFWNMNSKLIQDSIPEFRSGVRKHKKEECTAIRWKLIQTLSVIACGQLAYTMKAEGVG